MREKCLLGVYEKAFPEDISIKEMLCEAKRAGFDFFEMSIDRTEKRIGRLYDTSVIEMLSKDMETANIRIGSLALSAIGTYTLGNSEQKIADKAIDIAKQAVVFAEKLGIRIVQIPACDMPKYDERSYVTHTNYVRRLREIVAFAAAHGVILGLENMENDYMDTVEKCMQLVQSVDSPYLQLYPDAGNIMSAALLYGTDPCIDMNKGKGHYLGFHLKETRPNKYGGLFFGEGHVDFVRLTKRAYELGVRRYVMEFWYNEMSNWKQDLQKAYLFFDATLNDS